MTTGDADWYTLDDDKNDDMDRDTVAFNYGRR